MAGAREGRAVYRKRVDGKTVELWDDLTGSRCAATQLAGKAVFATLEIECARDASSWTCMPNRKVLPTSWRLAESGGARETFFSQRVPPKLLNPLGRHLLALERVSPSDGRSARAEEGQSQRSGTTELFHVIDARPNGVGRLLNVSVTDWALVRDETPVATLGYSLRPEPRSHEREERGLLSRVRSMARSLGSHDRSLTSLGDVHVLDPAEALVLLLLFESLTDVS